MTLAITRAMPRFLRVPIIRCSSIFNAPHTALGPRSTRRLFSADDTDWGIDKELAKLEKDLNEEKKEVFRLVLREKKNVFVTGAAGTGKSHLLKTIIKGLTIKYLDEALENPPKFSETFPVAITASTGLAACNIAVAGTTIHSFAGIGTGEGPVSKLIEKVQSRSWNKANWEDVEVLIIDEISMISAELFDKLDSIARKIRGNNLPFGGIQLVLTGDFFQLPPVLRNIDDDDPRFCFEARTWKTAVKNTIHLKDIYRQQDDEFVQMLREIRYGHISDKTLSAFKSCERPLPQKTNEAMDAAELYPMRGEADRANNKRLKDLPGPTWTYTALDDSPIRNDKIRDRLLSSCIAPKELSLKMGARVLLIKNIPENKRLVNGAQGRIIGFKRADSETGRPGLVISDKGGNILSESDLPLYPVVQFSFEDGEDEYHCVPATWQESQWKREWVPDRDEYVYVEDILGTRTQVPLILSWALSIHKAQGQTLDRVRVDLGRTFESGQAYVALSRVRTMEGLQVLNFDPQKVDAHPKVKAFYDSLSLVPTTRKS